jgi:hypothetical protein
LFWKKDVKKEGIEYERMNCMKAVRVFTGLAAYEYAAGLQLYLERVDVGKT